MDYRFEHEKLAQSFFSENSVRESAADTGVSTSTRTSTRTRTMGEKRRRGDTEIRLRFVSLTTP